MNRVSLVGRITKDPEVRYSQVGNAVLGFTIAVNRQQVDANGQRQADFINCVAFGQTADFISRYIKKGFLLAVTGRLQSRNYTGNDNQVHYVTEVVCDSVENLTPRDPNAQPQQQNNNMNYNNNNNSFRPQNPTYNNNNNYRGFNNPSYGSQNNQSYNYQPQDIKSQNEPAQQESFGVEVDDDDLPF